MKDDMRTYSTTTTASQPIDLQSVIAAMREFKKLPQPDQLWMHPNTMRRISEAIDRDEASVSLCELYANPSIRVSDWIPERDLKTRWVPPAGGRFCELGPEDECWARELGIGRVETVDLGAVIFKIKASMFDWLDTELMKPTLFMGMKYQP